MWDTIGIMGTITGLILFVVLASLMGNFEKQYLEQGRKKEKEASERGYQIFKALKEKHNGHFSAMSDDMDTMTLDIYTKHWVWIEMKEYRDWCRNLSEVKIIKEG